MKINTNTYYLKVFNQSSINENREEIYILSKLNIRTKAYVKKQYDIINNLEYSPKYIIFAKKNLRMSETEQILSFAALCVDASAKEEGCSRREMYDRLRRVGIIQGLTSRLDALHTQSRQYVVNEIRTALHRLEQKEQSK